LWKSKIKYKNKRIIGKASGWESMRLLRSKRLKNQLKTVKNKIRKTPISIKLRPSLG
jgi:hypothetical protein